MPKHVEMVRTKCQTKIAKHCDLCYYVLLVTLIHTHLDVVLRGNTLPRKYCHFLFFFFTFVNLPLAPVQIMKILTKAQRTRFCEVNAWIITNCAYSIDAKTAIPFVLKYFWLIWIWYLALKVIKGYIYYAHVASTSMKYLLFALTKGISSIPLSSSRRAGATTSIQPVPVFFSHIGLYFNRKRAKIQEIYQRLYQHIFLRNEILCVHFSGITFLS